MVFFRGLVNEATRYGKTIAILRISGLELVLRSSSLVQKRKFAKKMAKKKILMAFKVFTTGKKSFKVKKSMITV